jgi:wyosine [tRNA(Phe)-imidazoG37] synthetase (radical SAM superfamily)
MEKKNMSLLELQRGIIYGPINSRRLGSSLGLNIMPTGYKLCPFNCVYCHYGWTDEQALDIIDQLKDLPTPKQVGDALRAGLEEMHRRDAKPDYITFSGNGEPTVHPQFGEVVEVVREVRDQLVPAVKVVLLSNSTTIQNLAVRAAIKHIDLPIMKLDAGTEELFQKVNRPVSSITLEQIVSGLKQLDDFVTQTIFMRGTVDNATDQAVESWIKLIGEVRPKAAQIYTVDRWPADPGLEKVDKERLHEIAELAQEETGVEVVVY